MMYFLEITDYPKAESVERSASRLKGIIGQGDHGLSEMQVSALTQAMNQLMHFHGLLLNCNTQDTLRLATSIYPTPHTPLTYPVWQGLRWPTDRGGKR